MSTIQAPPAIPASLSVTSNSAPAVVIVRQPPTALLQLSPSSQIPAEVLAVLANGQAKIETPLGGFVINTSLPLKLNQMLLLQIPANPGGQKAPFVLNVTEITEKPVSPNVAQNAKSSGIPPSTVTMTTRANPSVPGGGSSPTTVSLTVGTSLNATLLTTTPALSPKPGGLFAPVPSTGPALPVPPSPVPTQSSAAPPAAPMPSAQPRADGLNQPHSHPSAVASGPSIAPASTTILQHAAGSRLQLTIQSLSPPSPGVPPGTTSWPLLPLVEGQVISGVVRGSTPSGHSVVQTSVATLSVPSSKPLPSGTRLTFRVDTNPQLPDFLKIVGPSLHREGLILSRSWPSLDEGLAVLQETSPSAAAQVSEHVLPKLNVKFSSTALFFLSALRGGDVRSWIGEGAAKVLEKIRPDLMRRLGEDFRALGAADEDNSGATVRTANWRGSLLPLLTQDGIEQIRLYTRHFGEDANEGDEREGVNAGDRFLVDVTLSNIGRLQLDGMMEKKTKRLDLIVRTSSQLPTIVRSEMMELFSKANAVVGMQGGMSFQAAPDSFVDPLPEQSDARAGAGIIV